MAKKTAVEENTQKTGYIVLWNEAEDEFSSSTILNDDPFETVQEALKTVENDYIESDTRPGYYWIAKIQAVDLEVTAFVKD